MKMVQNWSRWCIPNFMAEWKVKIMAINNFSNFRKRNTYDSIFVAGGSHGGFLSAHLSAARPSQFTAAAIANGVINLNTMRAVTDIPDWCDYQTFGYNEKFEHGSVPTDEQMKKMREASPISKSDQVKLTRRMPFDFGWRKRPFRPLVENVILLILSWTILSLNDRKTVKNNICLFKFSIY